MKKILPILLCLTVELSAQFDILKEVLKTGDELNKILLDFTRLTDDDENRIGEGLHNAADKESLCFEFMNSLSYKP